MKHLRDLPIKAKLAIGTAFAGCIAVLLACSALLILDWNHQRHMAQQQLAGIADIFAYNAAAAVAFEDPLGASEILSALAAQPTIVRARIFEAPDRPFADYLRSEDLSGESFPSEAPADGIRFSDHHLTVVRPILLQGDRIGSLYIQSDLSELRRALQWNLQVAAGVLISCILVALVIGTHVQRLIAKPILHLSEVARRVSEHNDYTLRAIKTGDDELGSLVDAFNGMLERIQSDVDLEKQRIRLQAEVDKRRRLYEDLKIQKDRAEAAVAAKTQFLTNTSHELRTPLTAILGFSEMLLDAEMGGAIGMERTDSLLSIKRNGEHLLTIINDILDLSKIEAGRMSLENIPFRPVAVAQDVRLLLEPKARQKDVALRIELDGPVPETIQGDPTRVKQILMNLIGNALKFTPDGSVIVRIGLRDFGKKPRIRFSVVDSGIGITEEQLGRLFRPFEQADNSTTREHGGTGLGLAICRQLADLMRGSIQVQSVPGEGSTFMLDLPTGDISASRWVEAAHAPREVKHETLSHHQVTSPLQVKVLVAEDSPDNRRLICYVLERAGARVETAPDGKIALDMVERAENSGKAYDLILMDMQMPVLDGYAATRELRRRGRTVPIIALTAHAMAGERQRCKEAGCNDFETKPLDRDRLIATIRRRLSLTRDRNLHFSGPGGPAAP